MTKRQMARRKYYKQMCGIWINGDLNFKAKQLDQKSTK